MKKIALGIGIAAILIAIPLTVFLVKRNQDIRQRAAPATTLEMKPATLSVSEGQEFSIDVVVTTGPNQITGADIKLLFDPEKLEAQSIQKGTFLPNILVAGAVAPGTASIALGAPSTTPGNGTGTLATVIFKALAATSSPVSIRFAQPETQVVGIGEQGNVLTGTTPTTITIDGGESLSGSPALAVSTPTPLPSSAPTASPSALPIGGTSPTASPSATVTTQITSPQEGTTTSARPTISGNSFATATITITITNTQPITALSSANSAGFWSYTPTTNLVNGAHTITVTAQHPTTKVVETAIRSFMVESSAQISTQSGIPVSATSFPTIALLSLGFICTFLGGIHLVRLQRI